MNCSIKSSKTELLVGGNECTINYILWSRKTTIECYFDPQASLHLLHLLQCGISDISSEFEDSGEKKSGQNTSNEEPIFFKKV